MNPGTAWGMLAVLGSVSWPAPTVAQADESITPAAIAAHVQVLAADSMQGRDTPSPALDRAAQYVAERFEALGLQVQRSRYPVPGTQRVDYTATTVSLSAFLQRNGREVVNERGMPVALRRVLRFTDGARPATAVVPEGRMNGAWLGVNLIPFRAKPILVSGQQTTASVHEAQALVRDRTVLYVPPAGSDSASRQRVIDALYPLSRGLVVLADEDAATFAARREAASRQPVVVADAYLEQRGWAAYLQPVAVEYVLRMAGIDVERIRTDSVPITRELPPLGIWLQTVLDTAASGSADAPNVLGILPGSDSVLRNEYVVFLAHLDQDGSGAGADDNASGVAGLLALAEALGRPEARPKRSVVFLATSGGAKGKDYWGSRYFVQWPRLAGPVVIGINLHMLGRGSQDSVRIDGLRDLELPLRPDWIAAQHPELRLAVVDGGTAVTSTSDHFAFVHHALPALNIHVGGHDEAASEDVPASLDLEQMARILRFTFHMGQEIANAEMRPRWSAEGRRQRGMVVGQ